MERNFHFSFQLKESLRHGDEHSSACLTRREGKARGLAGGCFKGRLALTLFCICVEREMATAQ